MAKYRVVIESPGHSEEHIFDADSLKDAEGIGQTFFDNACNYGVSVVTSDDDAGE